MRQSRIRDPVAPAHIQFIQRQAHQLSQGVIIERTTARQIQVLRHREQPGLQTLDQLQGTQRKLRQLTAVASSPVCQQFLKRTGK